MKRIFFLLALYLCIFAIPAIAEDVDESMEPGEVITSATPPVLPEVTTAIVMSSMDVNRIVCPGPIADVVYSGEKGFNVSYANNNAFVKFKVALVPDVYGNQTEVYADKPVEMFVICEDQTFSLIAQPQRVPAQTIRLNSGVIDSVRKNRSHFAGMPLKKKIVKLLREVYRGELEDSYKVREVNVPVELGIGLNVNHKRTIEVEGEGLVVKELTVTYSHTKNYAAAEITEDDFLSPSITTSALAVAIEDAVLNPGQSTSVFVVEKRSDN